MRVTSQFEFRCVNGSWSIDLGVEGASFQTPPAAGDFNTTLRKDCAFCIPNAPDMATHCSGKLTIS